MPALHYRQLIRPLGWDEGRKALRAWDKHRPFDSIFSPRTAVWCPFLLVVGECVGVAVYPSMTC